MLQPNYWRHILAATFSTKRIAAAIAFALLLLVSPMPASAHTGFESSDPTDGSILGNPATTVTVVFSAEAEPTGDGFQVLDAQGNLRTPTNAASPDGRTWILSFDPPLAGGEIGVRWKVKAPDKHPIEGSFRFTVDSAGQATTQETTEATPATTTGPTTSESIGSVAKSATIDDFLAVDASATQGASRLGTLGRFLSLSGTLIGIGALAFALLVLRGTSGDVGYVIYWVRRAGILALGGAVLESAAQLAIESGSWSGIWSPSTIWAVFFSSFGVAVALRAGGAYLLTTGTDLEIRPAIHAADPVLAVRELVGVGASHSTSRTIGRSESATRSPGHTGPGIPYHQDGDAVWAPTFESVGAFLGSALLLASFAFDGHTASKGDRVITAIVNTFHVAGAAVWVGGLLMLTTVLWRRKRLGRDLRSLQLALRFSVVAAIALAFVGGAGVLLTFIVLDSPQELWSTPWGRLLIAKSAVVGLAAGMGAYNHRVLIPMLSHDPDNPEVDREFRRTVTAESLTLLVVVILTAYLVGAAS